MDDPLFPMVSFLHDAAQTDAVVGAMFSGQRERELVRAQCSSSSGGGGGGQRRRVHPSQLPDAAANEAAAAFKAALSAADESEQAGDPAKTKRQKHTDAATAGARLLLTRAEQFKVLERDRELAVAEARRRVQRANAAAQVDAAAVEELDGAVARAWRLVAIAEDLNRAEDPQAALLPSERADADWTREEAALVQHPFVAELLKQTAHRAQDDAEGVAVAACEAFLGRDTPTSPRGVRCAMTLLKQACGPGGVTLAALHPLAQLHPWIACAADRDPVARALLWRVSLCALPLLRLAPVVAPRALGAAMGALGAAAYTVTTPAQGIRIVYLRIFSGCHNLIWTLRFGRAACDERLKLLREATAVTAAGAEPAAAAAEEEWTPDG